MSVIYKTVITKLDKVVPVRYIPLWNHPAAFTQFCIMFYKYIGPKTVFFWAPLFKLGLVAAGISDLRRPADQLSAGQSASLAATGLIWSRYCLVIIPKNYALCSVNAFVAITQLIQLFRAIRYQRSVQDSNNQLTDNNQ